VIVVAHRGYAAVAPENTLAAFAGAVASGADWVEFDVRTTADGVPVVIHDRTVDRTTDGHGAVADLTSAQLRRLDAGAWFSPAFVGQRVPTLAEVLDLLVPAAPGILLEVKRPATARQVEAIIAEITDRSLVDRVVLQSFSDQVLCDSRELAPGLRRGVLRDGLDADPVATAAAFGAVMYNPSVDDVLRGPDAVGRLRAAGVQVLPWTANEAGAWPVLAPLVDGLITDRAGALVGWRHGRNHRPQD
jgi:glycerophosphoryl diester phosphodiesterase